MARPLALSYVLPLRSSTVREDLDDYLEALSDAVEVIVVDGSDEPVFEAHERRWKERVLHLPVDHDLVTPMGKVGGVLTGLRRATFDAVVVADDDTRWDLDQLGEALQRMDGVDVLRPQNWFDPAPWHARWDTGRILLNRVFGGDWPGTMVVDRRTLARTGGYDGSVMFENLELIRTVQAAGGCERLALDLLVRRLPPSTAEFVGQRVRQAYDELARPWRLVAGLAIVPGAVIGGRRVVLVLAAASVVLAEVGRRRAGGRAVFRPTGALWAPVWVAERGITSWLAVASRLRYGGVRYRGNVLRRAATSKRRLRAIHATHAAPMNA